MINMGGMVASPWIRVEWISLMASGVVRLGAIGIKY